MAVMTNVPRLWSSSAPLMFTPPLSECSVACCRWEDRINVSLKQATNSSRPGYDWGCSLQIWSATMGGGVRSETSR